MSVQSEVNVNRRVSWAPVASAGVVAVLFAILGIMFAAGVFWHQNFNSQPPSAMRQLKEVAALETHVLPLVKDLRATWYLDERFGSSSINWKRGDFTNDPARARQDGLSLFDTETEEAFEQFSRAIRASGVATSRLYDASFADDGTLSAAWFERRGGGLKYVFRYIYSPEGQPEAWTSNLGPVVLTRIGDSDWWLEQSPND